MRRFHLFEIMDQPWCPASLRDAMTDYLQAANAAAASYLPVAQRLAQALARTGERRVIDLCAGGGGPWLQLRPVLEATLDAPLVICLTDRYPNQDAAARSGAIAYPAPVDARTVPAGIAGFRTIFSGLHHFRPADAQAILADAVRHSQGIAVFEATGRTPVALLSMALVPLATLLLMPTVRPFRLNHLLWGYLVPLLPAAAFFDGVVSCLRTYTPAELQALAAAADPAGAYHWEVGQEPARRGPIPVTYLIGRPRASSEQHE